MINKGKFINKLLFEIVVKMIMLKIVSKIEFLQKTCAYIEKHLRYSFRWGLFLVSRAVSRSFMC